MSYTDAEICCRAARWQQAWLWSKLAAVSDSVQGTNSSDAQASGASNAQSSSRDADSEPSSSGASTPVVDLWGKLGYGSACQCKDGSHCKLWMMPQDANSGVSSQPQALTRAHALSVKYEFMCSTENRMGSIDLGLKACHHREQGTPTGCLLCNSNSCLSCSNDLSRNASTAYLLQLCLTQFLYIVHV